MLGRAADAWSYAQSYFLTAGISALALPALALSRRQNAAADTISAPTDAETAYVA